MKDLVKDLYSGTAKRSNTRYSIWISPEWLCWYCGTYIIMAIIGIYFMSKNVDIKIYTKILVVVVIFFYPQILYLELYAYRVFRISATELQITYYSGNV
jgi:hypothetical protein